MNIVFIGDVSIDRAVQLPRATGPFARADHVVANLEGAIAERAASSRNGFALVNTPAVVDALASYGVTAVSLANNHTYDLDQPVDATIRRLSAAGIATFGAGSSARAAQPATLRAGEESVVCVGFGWQVIGCRPARGRSEGVNPFTAAAALSAIRAIRAVDPRSFVVFAVHWNYELERYPQPAHRQLAFDLVDEGVDAVIGHHPHVVGGIEFRNGKLIAYSLGNWLFPPRTFGSLELRYPRAARRQLALELETTGRSISKTALHWYEAAAESGLPGHEVSEGPDGPIARELTPFAGMKHDEYIEWFRTNRLRKRALPIYENHRHRFRNGARDVFVHARQAGIRALLRVGLKGGPRE